MAEIEMLEGVRQAPRGEWDALVADQSPFLEWGWLAALEESGTPLPDADIQIAATAIYHNLQIVTGNLRHFQRVPGLTINSILVDCRNH